MIKNNFLVLVILFSGIHLYGMEPANLNEKRYLEIENASVACYLGANLRWYKEYKPQLKENGKKVSFPVECTDPLPINHFGDSRFFITSAQAGSMGNKQNTFLTITDPSITQMAVVRCIAESNSRAGQVYIGYDANNYKRVGYKGKDRVYSGEIMHIASKEHSGYELGYPWYAGHKISDSIGHFGSMQIGLEVRKHISSDHLGWKDPVFQAKVNELLGENLAGKFNFQSQSFVSSDVYWTKDENKLKQIKYHSAK